MFDQYGTIVDMQSGLTEAAAPFLRKKGWSGNPNSFVTWWRRTHFENSMIDALLHKEHTPYREIGHRSVSFVLDRAGIEYTTEEVHHLVAEIEKLPPSRKCPRRSHVLRRATAWLCCLTAIPTCSRPPNHIISSHSIESYRWRRLNPSNRMWRLTRRPRSCSI